MTWHHIRVWNRKIDTVTGTWAHIWHISAIFARYVPNLDTPIVASCRNLIWRTSKAKRIYPWLVVNLLLFHRGPHWVDIQLVEVITGCHSFTSLRESNLGYVWIDIVGVFLTETVIIVPELDRLVMMTCGHNRAIGRKLEDLGFRDIWDVSFLLSAVWYLIFIDHTWAEIQVDSCNHVDRFRYMSFVWLWRLVREYFREFVRRLLSGWLWHTIASILHAKNFILFILD